MITLRSLLEVDPYIGSPIVVFGDQKFLEDNTRLQKWFPVERCNTAYKYDREDYRRELAPFSGRSAKSITVETKDSSVKMIGVAHSRINHVFKGEQLNALRSPGGITPNAAAEVQKARRALRQRLLLTKEKMCSDALMGGTVAINPTITGVSVSYPNFGTLAVSADWSNPATIIASKDVINFRAQQIGAIGLDIEGFLFNETVTSYLLGNAEIQNYIHALPRSEQQISSARLGQMAGVPDWVEYRGTYKPKGGAATRFVTNKSLLAYPAAKEQYLAWAAGQMDIPAEGIVSRDANALLPGVTWGDSDGIFEYFYATPDPVSIVLVAEIAGFPIVKLPEAFAFEADVTS
jgi:hypothetical protein